MEPMEEVRELIMKAERMIRDVNPTNQHVVVRWLKLAVRRLYQLNSDYDFNWVYESCTVLRFELEHKIGSSVNLPLSSSKDR